MFICVNVSVCVCVCVCLCVCLCVWVCVCDVQREKTSPGNGYVSGSVRLGRAPNITAHAEQVCVCDLVAFGVTQKGR